MIDACSLEPAGLISIEIALTRLSQSLSPVIGYERVRLKEAQGRVLYTDVYSAIDIPGYRHSAMDGYAFSGADIMPGQSFCLRLSGVSWAGRPFNQALKPGECVRVFTGAVIPERADSVIMQEQVRQQGEQILFPDATVAQQFIREVGSDTTRGALLLAAGKMVSAVDLGLLASAGIYDIVVRRKLNIGFFSTGDELCPIGQTLMPGQVYDSNRYTLTGLLNHTCFNVYDLGVLADDKTQLENALLSASKSLDVLMTTGGASVGEADYIQQILAHCGQVKFWKIAMKPGKPLAFGMINQCCFFGLPGNPVSVVATFDQVVLPGLERMAGLSVRKPLKINAVCTHDLKKQAGRQDYQRGRLSQDESGNFFVSSTGQQESNMMRSLSQANCYIVLPIDSVGVRAGQVVTVEPFSHRITD